MKRRLFLLLAAALAAAPLHAQQWKPTKPITIIVPWAAGGSTDQVTRITAAELEKPLGPEGRDRQPAGRLRLDRHQERARSAEGRLHLDRRRRAGPRHLPGARHAGHQYRGLAPVPERRQRPAGRRQPEHAVQDHEGAARRDEGEARRRSRSRPPASLRAGTTPWRRSRAPPACKYRHVTYDGGNPAVVATVAGETQVTTQLAVEQAEMIRGKRLRPARRGERQAARARGLRHDRADHARRVPSMKIPTNYFGIFIPKGVPPEVVATVERIWSDEHRPLRGAEEVRHQPRRAVRAVVGRAGAEGGHAGGPGQCLAAARRRQDEGFARHGRHSEAVSGGAKPSPRADLVWAALWLAFGGDRRCASWTMDRLERLGAPALQRPGPRARPARRWCCSSSAIALAVRALRQGALRPGVSLGWQGWQGTALVLALCLGYAVGLVGRGAVLARDRSCSSPRSSPSSSIREPRGERRFAPVYRRGDQRSSSRCVFESVFLVRLP